MSKFKNDDDKMIVFIDQIKKMIDMLDKMPQNPRCAINDEYYLTDAELSKILRVSRRTLQEYRTKGDIPYYIIVGKVLYRESDIQKWLEKYYRQALCDRKLI